MHWTCILLLLLAAALFFARRLYLPRLARLHIHRGMNPQIRAFMTKELKRFPLHWAVFQNDYWTADKLLDGGCTVADETDDGQTPLHVAAEAGLPGMCRFLLKNGAEVNAPDNFGGTPLHAAAACQSGVRVVRLLVKKGADPFLKDRAGMTPLALAEKYGNADITFYLKKLKKKP